MQIETKEIGNATLLQVSGEVDMSNSPQVRNKLIGFIKKKPPAILVDLGGVTYMDSSGIATLVEGLQETMGYGGKFRLVSLTPKVRQVFELARLTEVFEIYSDLSSAQEGL